MDIEKIIARIPSMTPAERQEMRHNSERRLKDPKLAGQAQAVLDALERQAAAEAAALAERVAGLPMARRVAEAFTAKPMTEKERDLVQVLLDHPGSTSKELSRALGWEAQSWHLHFGTMCQQRQGRLWPAARAEKRDANFYSGILAELSPDNRFTLRPEVAEGFAALGLKPADKA